jgi:hypothetical protein
MLPSLGGFCPVPCVKNSKMKNNEHQKKRYEKVMDVKAIL